MVTKRPKGLGRGLEALLGPTFDENAANHAANLAAAKAAEMANPGTPSTLMLTDLVAGQYQPRPRHHRFRLYPGVAGGWGGAGLGPGHHGPASVGTASFQPDRAAPAPR